ncbi:CCA tRNA nucleotidyltransferase, mitochondrial-like [Rosa rugosa]|uniref:CCA tRNA nucleotidyltransferase, mitochondrial-like n=1 Tax=Rosa rugosa TaxID=74645 RepID=UPI002B40D578|nr:CCA tRNA nucleotidyltransferase, mitochondrial-like [Rosa rugosa]
MSPPRVQVNEHIDLNETETKIFDILLKTLCHNGLENLQLHVADGWVRDKLLGKDYGDIDIAVEDMRGIKFAEKVKDYLYSVGKEQAITYFPGKEKDACRRDITINSLLCNINSKSVEDHTGRGTADLKEGRIATTTPPELSLVEDPKRVLRAIRYGAKFGFFLDDDIKKAAASDEVKAALMSKVSRDRINVEVSSCHPQKKIDLIIFYTSTGRRLNYLNVEDTVVV